MDETSYPGSHQAAFNKVRIEVPILMRQTMIDMAVRCGLDFQDGWQIPLTVRFDDFAPGGVENVLAFVQMGQASDGSLQQHLVINLQAYDHENFNFNKVFAHELVHAMLNDSLGEASTRLPVWFHEGLAVYGANQGEQMMQVYLTRVDSGNPAALLNGLDGPHGAIDYLEDYLAFKYIREKCGLNSFHNFIREVITRGGDIPGAINYTCHQSWEEFQANARKYAEEELTQVGRSLRTNTYHSDQPTKPY